jgi:hypothetical protein
MRGFPLSLLLLFCSPAYASCWVVENLSGHSAKAFNQYESRTDRPSRTITLQIKGESSTISDSDAPPGQRRGVTCKEIASTTVSCQTRLKDVVEVYTCSVDVDAGKGFCTLLRSGTGLIDGVANYVGDARVCK